MLVLTVTAGPEPGRNLELSGDRPLIFGRFSLIGEVVDAKLSRRHALFRRDNGRWTVQDLGSRNGTFVNGQPIGDAALLHEGDEIRLGRTVLRVAMVGEPALARSPVVESPMAASAVIEAAPAPPPVPPASRGESPLSAELAAAAKQPSAARPESPLTAPPNQPASSLADIEQLIEQELDQLDDSVLDGTVHGDFVEEVELLDDADLQAVAASVDEVVVDGGPPPVTDVSTVSEDSRIEPTAEMVAAAVSAPSVEVRPATRARPGDAARAAEPATQARAVPSDVARAPATRPRGRGRRVARFAVVGLLLVVAGIAAAFVVKGLDESDQVARTQADNERLAAEVSRALTEPDAAPPRSALQDSVARMPPPEPIRQDSPVSQAPTTAGAQHLASSQPPVDDAMAMLDPYRPVDSFAGTMGSAGRMSLTPPPTSRAAAPEPDPEPERIPVAPQADLAAVPLPELPTTSPLVNAQLAVAVPPVADAAVNQDAQEPPPRARRPPRPDGLRVRPAPLDDAERVVFIVDTSGSMIDTLPLVIQELDRIIAQLASDQQFTVLFYQKDQVIEVEPTGLKDATRRNKVLASRWMDPKAGHVFAVGPSYPGEAIRAAMRYQPDQIFLLADKVGASIHVKEQTQKLIAELDQLNADRQVQINTVHFFYPDPHQGLSLIAAGHGGTYRFVSLDEVGSDVARPAGDPLRDSLLLLLESKPQTGAATPAP